jgi:ribosomal protein S18 acetylase RimI-like enzyme
MTVWNIDPDGSDDLERAGQLLHDFNLEFTDPTPGPSALAERLRELTRDGDTAVLLGGPDRDTTVAVAVLRLRKGLWSTSLECYLAELYVAPAHRGRGLGRAMLSAAISTARRRGADYMDLNTSETDRVARALYESAGFSRTEGKVDGPLVYYYELDL